MMQLFRFQNLSSLKRFHTAPFSTSRTYLACQGTRVARVCVTVGMMTTGYDCEDLLNIVLLRPIFSPTDFIQIKGRGTRTHNFLDQLFDESLRAGVQKPSMSAASPAAMSDSGARATRPRARVRLCRETPRAPSPARAS